MQQSMRRVKDGHVRLQHHDVLRLISVRQHRNNTRLYWATSSWGLWQPMMRFCIFSASSRSNLRLSAVTSRNAGGGWVHFSGVT